MEAFLLPSTPDQSIYPYKQNRSPRKNSKNFIFRPYKSFSPSTNPLLNIHEGGHRSSLSSSFSSSISVLNQQRQPPLLPLPTSKPYFSLPSHVNRGGGGGGGSLLLSPPTPTNKKINNRTRDQDHTPKKPKSSTIPKKHDSKTLVITSTNRLGPDPSDLPKGVSRVFKPIVPSTATVTPSVNASMKGVEEISGSIYSLAPPPSSLPLPKFSLKPKLSCNVEAGGLDVGATDNLRRLLRLR